MVDIYNRMIDMVTENNKKKERIKSNDNSKKERGCTSF